jgi:adenylate cyclase class IV
MYKDIEVAIDKVDNLGRFIEFEAKWEFLSIEEARAYLYSLAEEMWTQLDVQDKKGYPYVLLEQEGII